MQIKINRSKLLASIQDVHKAISSRAAIPILTGMKIEGTNEGVVLTGSNSDISIESFIPKEEDGVIHIDHIENGSIVIQAKYFVDIIQKLPESTVTITADENLKVTITSGQAKFNLNGQDAADYPQLPKLHTEDSFQIPSDLLKGMIRQTVFAISTMETRPILTGVNMTLKDGQLNFTATDSHRLAQKQIPLQDATQQFSNLVVPGKSLNELNKILPDSDEPVEISAKSNLILFKTKNVYFLSRLLDGNYPETSRLIPTESQTTIQVKTSELLHAIDRASLLATQQQNNIVKITTIDENTIEITSNSPEIGHVAEKIFVTSVTGEDLNISFSARYMLEALRAIESEEVTIAFTGAMRPFIIRPTGDDSVLQLILPVRTF